MKLRFIVWPNCSLICKSIGVQDRGALSRGNCSPPQDILRPAVSVPLYTMAYHESACISMLAFVWTGVGIGFMFLLPVIIPDKRHGVKWARTMASAFWWRIIANHGVTAQLFFFSRVELLCVSILCFRGWMPPKTMSTALWINGGSSYRYGFWGWVDLLYVSILPTTNALWGAGT